MCKKIYKNLKRSGWLSLVLIIMLIIGGNNQLIAGDQVWTTNGPYGGQIFYIASNPLNPSIIYAGAPGGVCKSIDGGDTWEIILSQGIVNSEKKIAATQIYLDPANPNIVYVTCYYAGVYRSTNAGLSWEYLGFANTSERALGIVTHPSLSQNIYVSTRKYDEGVFMSSDNGLTWTDIGASNVKPIIFDPFQYNTLYTGCQYGVFRKSPSDTTWVSISNGFPPDEVNIESLMADPFTPGVMYAVSGYYGLYKTTDYGENWVLKNDSIGNKSDWKLDMFAIAPSNTDILYAVADEYLIKSIDGGDNWTELIETDKTFISVEVDQNNPDIVYVGDVYNGILKTTDGGINWDYSNNGLAFSLMSTISLNPAQSDVLYAGGTGGDQGGSFFKSIDYGENWIAFNQNLSGKSIRSILADPNNADVIWAGTRKNGLFKSIDGGLNWSFVDIGITGNISKIENILIDPIDNDIIYVTHKSDIYKTTDGGLNWFVVSSLPGWNVTIKQLEIEPNNPSTLYVSGGGFWDAALYKSTDGGSTWSEILVDAIDCFALDPVDSLIIYYSNFDNSGMKKTTNGGQTWISVDNGLGWFSPYHAWVTSIVIDPDNHNIVYAGLMGVGGSPWGIPGGVYKTINGGYLWEPMMDGLDIWDVRKLVLDTRTSTLHAAIGQGGVWSYELNPSIMPASIVEIVDVPDDQGKQVLLTWEASGNDQVTSSRPVSQYGIWRKIDMTSKENTGDEPNGLVLEGTKELFILGEWYAIGSVLALQDSLYYYIAPTLADSNANGLNYSTFMITAHTQDPLIWSASVPDSGYSVDNIAPEAPFDLTGNIINNSVNLNWQAQFSYPDFSYFTIYRDTISGFVPNANNRIATSIYQTYIDNTVSPDQNYRYVISAFDFNGNESSYSNEETVNFFGIDEQLNNLNYSLFQNYPNPFNNETTIHFTTVASDKNTVITIYNFNGQKIKTLVSKRLSAGTHQIVWDGTDYSGNAVSGGIYFYKMECGDKYIGLKKMILMK